jgi:DNA-binding transcriptional regulator GbsR (MarR family)
MTATEQRFVQHFGEMGSRWGINRTVGQIYALLYLSERPLHADEIAERLGFSRSNVSMGLKELESWQLVRLQHQPGDRKEYYSTPDDVWAIFRTLAAEKRKREVDPTLSMLRESLLDTAGDAASAHALQRIRAMHDLIELASRWFDDVQRLDSKTLTQLMRLGSRVQRLLEAKNRLALVGGKRGGS